MNTARIQKQDEIPVVISKKIKGSYRETSLFVCPNCGNTFITDELSVNVKCFRCGYSEGED